MTTDTEAGTPAVLHEALVTAAGPQRALTPVALRGLLVGVDPTVVAEVLSRVMAEGVALPPAAVAAFGLQGGSAAPAAPELLATARPLSDTQGERRVPAGPKPEPRRPRFTLELRQDSRLDLSALTIQALRLGDPSASRPPLRAEKPYETPAGPATAPAAPPPPRPRPEPTAEAPQEDGSPRQPVFDSLKHYRKEIGRFPLLSRQQEAELARAIEAGVLARNKLDEGGRKLAPKLRSELQEITRRGERAFTEFAEANLRLVMSIAAKYTGRGLDLMDLVQEGNLGMVHAIELFDHRRGSKFSTYAVPWIRQAITRAIADQSRTIRLPVHAHDAVTALHRAARALTLDSPHDDLPAVAARVGTPVDEARTLLSRVRATVPLEALAEAIGDDMLHEEFDRTAQAAQSLEDEPDYLGLSPDEVLLLLDHLSPREARVLALRHGVVDGGPGLTLDAIGRELGVTRERVRQIEKLATGVLRDLVVAYRMSRVVLPARPSEPRRTRTRPAWVKTAPTASKSTALPGAAPPSGSAAPPVFTSERHRVNSSGYITVEGQAISVGAALSGGTVVVLVQEDLLRVIHDGRQLTTAPRQRIGDGGGTDGAEI
ncbi:sigma-70 family RNA polymerase sigma factor [Streptomyces sp. bgisy034]|uniref:sigma-70 family RNA polymerase sigma factor n=1 Tax=Streptomyces sp. bgisy034 TaxID=3413774 RepID=UPI003EBED875